MVAGLCVGGEVSSLSSGNLRSISRNAVHDSGSSGVSVGSGISSRVGGCSITRGSCVGMCTVVGGGGGSTAGGRSGGIVSSEVGSLGGGDFGGVSYGLGCSVGSCSRVAGIAVVAVLGMSHADSDQAEDHDL